METKIIGKILLILGFVFVFASAIKRVHGGGQNVDAGDPNFARPAGQAAPPEPAKLDKATQARVSRSYGKLPLSFEANEGQQNQQVQFLCRGSGYDLFLTNREAVLVLTKPENPASPPARKATLSQRERKGAMDRFTRDPCGSKSSSQSDGRGGVAGQGQLPRRQRSLQVAHRCGDLRQNALRTSLSGRRPGLLRQPGETGIRFCRGTRSRSGVYPTQDDRCARRCA